MEKPSQHLLNEFYKIVSCERLSRLASIKQFLKCEELNAHAEYIVERLIAGLNSPRAASRHGFSVALTLFFAKLDTKFPLNQLFEMADKLIDVDNLESSSSIIAYQLLCTCCCLSGKYNEELDRLVRKQLELANTYAFLAACVSDAIVKLCTQLSKSEEGREIFKQKILSQIRFKICKSVADMSTDEFLLLAGLKSTFSKILRNECDLIKNKRVVLSEADYLTLIEMLKKTDTHLKLRLILTILEIGRENEAFQEYFKKIFVEYAWHGDLSKAAERYFRLLGQICASELIHFTEILSIMDVELIRNIRKYAHRADLAFRGIHTLIHTLLDCIAMRLDAMPNSESSIVQQSIFEVLTRLDEVEGGDFDTKCGTKIKLSVIFFAKLRGKYFDRFLEKVTSSTDAWSVRRLEHIYRNRQASEKVKILNCLVVRAKSLESYFEIVCALLNDIFVVKFRRGGCLGSTLSSPDDMQVLREVAMGQGAKLLNYAVDSDEYEMLMSLDVLSCSLHILGSASLSAIDRREYFAAAKEVRHCARKFKCDVIVDLLISVLIHRNRVHKALVSYVFANLCAAKKVSSAEAKFLIDTMCKSDAEITGEDAEHEDEDFKPITEAELKNLMNKGQLAQTSELEKNNDIGDDENVDNDETDCEENDDIEEDDDMEENEDDDMDSDEDDDEEDEVDPQLVSDVRQALGKAALNLDASDEDEADDENIENMDDAEIQKLDAALTDAFRRNSSKQRKMRQEELKVFRGKCLDLINIFICMGPLQQPAEEEVLSESLKKAAKKLRQMGITDFQQRIEGAAKAVEKRTRKLKNGVNPQEKLEFVERK